MPRFKVVSSLKEINQYDSWNESTKFNSKDKFVNLDGEYVTETYKGPKYQLVSKKERNFTFSERLVRGFFGTLFVVGTLGIGFFSKDVKKLFLKQKQSMRFGILVTQLPTSSNQQKPSTSKTTPAGNKPQKVVRTAAEERQISEVELQKGISISDKALLKIQRCVKEIFQDKKPAGVRFYEAQHTHRVFELDKAPGVIFKMTTREDNPISNRYDKMIDAQTVLRTHQLGLLVLPHAKLFEVDADGERYQIIAEEKLDIDMNSSRQEQYFEEYADSLNEAISQLATFICKTGYSDVEYRNNPVLNNSLGADGHRKIALIDIEEMEDAEEGLFSGYLGRTGLVNLVTEAQGEMVKKVAEENNVGTSNFATAQSRRKKTLEDTRELKEYYAAKKIIRGDEPIHVDLASLGLNLEERENEHSLGKVAEYIVATINDFIKDSDPEASRKGRRYMLLNTNHGQLNRYQSLGSGCWGPDEDRWIHRVITALVNKGHIFKLDKINGHGYFLQA